MYYAAGTSIDWAYGCANIPYSYMVELRSKEHRFLLPKDEILCTSSEIFCGVKTLMAFIDRRCAPVRRTSSCCSFKSICSRDQLYLHCYKSQSTIVLLPCNTYMRLSNIYSVFHMSLVLCVIKKYPVRRTISSLRERKFSQEEAVFKQFIFNDILNAKPHTGDVGVVL